jgi:hypothetical protein
MLRNTPVTAHPQDPKHDEANCLETVPRRSGRAREAFKPVFQVGWNIASLVFGGRIRKARDIALFNDHEAGLAYSRKHEKKIRAKIQEMLNYPH